MKETNEKTPQAGGVEEIHLPSPTAWPMVLGLGVTLMLGGLITHVAITVLGAVLALLAVIGWFRNVLPHEQHELVRAKIDAQTVAVSTAKEPAPPAARRAHSALTTYSFLSGIEAGAAGGVAMAIPAVVYSMIRFKSLWYAVNLMAASSFLGWTDASDSFLSQFHFDGLLVGLAVHVLISLLVGMLYASILPIFPRFALLSGGVLTPLLWSGLAYALMASVTPVLGARVDWPWFILSQIAYGVVAALVVSMRVKIRTAEFQKLPFAERAGLHSNEAHSNANPEVRP